MIWRLSFGSFTLFRIPRLLSIALELWVIEFYCPAAYFTALLLLLSSRDIPVHYLTLMPQYPNIPTLVETLLGLVHLASSFSFPVCSVDWLANATLRVSADQWLLSASLTLPQSRWCSEITLSNGLAIRLSVWTRRKTTFDIKYPCFYLFFMDCR